MESGRTAGHSTTSVLVLALVLISAFPGCTYMAHRSLGDHNEVAGTEKGKKVGQEATREPVSSSDQPLIQQVSFPEQENTDLRLQLQREAKVKDTQRSRYQKMVHYECSSLVFTDYPFVDMFAAMIDIGSVGGILLSSFLYSQTCNQKVPQDETIVETDDWRVYMDRVPYGDTPFEVHGPMFSRPLGETTDEEGRLDVSVPPGFLEDTYTAKYRSDLIRIRPTGASEQEISAKVNLSRTDFRDFMFGVHNLNPSEPEPDAPPYPEASLHLLNKEPIRAGEDIRLKVMVDNTRGQGSLYRCYGFTSSELEPLDDRYVFFGQIEGGEKQTRVFNLPTDHRWDAREIDLDVHLREANGYLHERKRARIHMSKRARPRFQVTYQLFDDQGGKGVGNGDGILQIGEGPVTRINVHNTGNGSSGALSVTVNNLPRNPGPIDLFSKTSFTKSPLAPGQSTSVPLHFALKEGFTKDELTFQVVVREDKFDQKVSRQVRIPVGEKPDQQAITVNRIVRAAEQEVPVFSGSSTDTNIIGYLGKGSPVRARKLINNFYQLQLDEKRIGWVQKSRVNQLRRNRQVDALPEPDVDLSTDDPPFVVLKSPSEDQLSGRSSVEVVAEMRDDREISSYQVLRNGRTVEQSSISAKEETIRTTVSLANGTNRIKVVASDHGGNKQSDQAVVNYFETYPELTGFYESVHVLIIGINEYRNPSVPDLGYAVKDARAMEELLKEQFVTGSVQTLINEEATRENILRILQGDLSKTSKEDAVLVYYAGHGKTFSASGERVGYLVPHDGSFERTERAQNISMQLFRSDIVPMTPARHFLTIVDACYGGLMTQPPTRGGGVREVSRQQRAEYLKQIRDRPANLIMTAGKEGETVLDRGADGHSVFTNHLLKGLKRTRRFQTAKKLFSSIRQKVILSARQYNHEQHPQLQHWGDQGDFVFIKKE